MNIQISSEIVEACQVLFGSNVKITPEFLGTLNPSELKEQYRKRAREYHPDRAGLMGRKPSDMNELITNVNIAYERLSGHVKITGSTPPTANGQESMGVSIMGTDPGNGTWEGPLPENELLIGQYLFYSGLITRDNLVGALARQRGLRPAFGNIARMWGYLTEEDSDAVAVDMAYGERFGVSAVRQGYMTAHQRRTVLKLQGWLQEPIGRYFTERGILTAEEISCQVKALRKHNARVLSSNQ